MCPRQVSSWTPTNSVVICGHSRRGAAGGPSGMTMEHLRLLLHEARGLELFSELCSRLAQAKVPPPVIDMLRAGRLTALAKPDGGVRGIVAGDVIRRLVARTMAHQMAEIVERATTPHQYALSTRGGCECVAHVLQGLTELDPETTVTSIDGIGAYDTISREAMLRACNRRTTPRFHLCACSTGPHPSTCGKTTRGWSTGFHKVRVVSRGTH